MNGQNEPLKSLTVGDGFALVNSGSSRGEHEPAGGFIKSSLGGAKKNPPTSNSDRSVSLRNKKLSGKSYFSSGPAEDDPRPSSGLLDYDKGFEAESAIIHFLDILNLCGDMHCKATNYDPEKRRKSSHNNQERDDGALRSDVLIWALAIRAPTQPSRQLLEEQLNLIDDSLLSSGRIETYEQRFSERAIRAGILTVMKSVGRYMAI